jgi:hypothetical protein
MASSGDRFNFLLISFVFSCSVQIPLFVKQTKGMPEWFKNLMVLPELGKPFGPMMRTPSISVTI